MVHNFAQLTVAVAVTAIWAAPANAAEAQTPITITKERMTEETIANLVAVPLAAAKADDVSGGMRLFEARLTNLPLASIERADLTIAFGVALYAEGVSRADAGVKTQAIGLLGRAVDAYRAAFGPRHPEVAVALNSFADAARYQDERDPPVIVDRSLREAYDIRVAALGANHPETLSNLIAVAEVDGLAARTRGDRKRIDSATATLRYVARTEPTGSAGHAVSVAMAAAFALPIVELTNGRDAAARHNTRIAVDRARKLQGPDNLVCDALITGAAALANAFAAKDLQADADELLKAFVLPEAKNVCSPVSSDVL